MYLNFAERQRRRAAEAHDVTPLEERERESLSLWRFRKDKLKKAERVGRDKKDCEIVYEKGVLMGHGGDEKVRVGGVNEKDCSKWRNWYQFLELYI